MQPVAPTRNDFHMREYAERASAKRQVENDGLTRQLSHARASDKASDKQNESERESERAGNAGAWRVCRSAREGEEIPTQR